MGLHVIDFVNKYARNVHSQNGEDGILLEALRRIGDEKGHAVEIGGNDGRWMSNTRLLLDEHGWSGAFIETEWPLYLKCQANWLHRKDVKCICSRVDGHNVNAFVKDDCDLLSIDTDGADYKIFHGLLVKPKIVIVEIDSSIPPDVLGFNADGGAGYLDMVRLGLLRGYFLLCHTGNLIFVDDVHRNLFPEITADPILEPWEYFKTDWLKAA